MSTQHKITFLPLMLLFISIMAYAANRHDLEKLMKVKPNQPNPLDLSHVDLRRYTFAPDQVDLRQANLAHSNLSGVNLSKMDLTGANLSYANLAHTKLNQANLAAANLSYTNLTGAELFTANLAHANLSYATLNKANLRNTNLSKANLTCASLDQADLNQSNVSGAIISGATFTNTLTDNVTGYHLVIDQPLRCTYF